MAVREIRLYPDPVLRRPAKPVTRVTKKLARLAQDMAETMYAANGVGLAAPQVGKGVRLAVVDVGDGLITLFNPVIVAREGTAVDVEGCLSIPKITAYVERAAQVTVEALDLEGRPFRVEADGLLARALQHEIDHLDGILIVDRATRLFREEEREGEEEPVAVEIDREELLRQEVAP
ncbi:MULTISPECIES: peptide deformylase [Limnochorda]|uniref:peptide deformylase n=1 Tax=Limnochorda TaxID=1676651 RepID=UPI00181338EC|nr:peptide deformylase [Limnochorda pilosa]MBO2486872.1 peptide deformylase [Bacillota bacterium]MBO2519446.1 peptide deformylase [Bacillota bacterium]NMA70307.1 peptide deformylase [Bacillota bacterium]